VLSVRLAAAVTLTYLGRASEAVLAMLASMLENGACSWDQVTF
jgi:hypothetical protein